MTDEELMAAYANGDLEAFRALYDRHKQRIFGYLITKLRDRNDAEDVFQSVFAKLHVARKRYKQGIPYLPWVFTITRNVLLDHVRKKSTYSRHITISEEAVDCYADPSPETAHISLVIGKLSSLTDAQRQALELRFNEGLTFSDISAQMQTTGDNARQIISRAIRKLRRLMKGEETFSERD